MNSKNNKHPDRRTFALDAASKAIGENTAMHNVGKGATQKATNTEVKYDINHFVFGDFVDTDDKNVEFEQGRNKQYVKGRLKRSIEFWKNTLKVNDFVIETIKDGYKLPLKETPIKTELRNNMSAIQNSDFVNEALKELIVSNSVIEVQNKPHVINPLSVSTNSSGKKRLILDLLYVNKHLWKQSVKFEDWKTFQNYVKKGSFMYKFDLRHGYHHIDIFPEHQTFLGFSWFYEGKLRYFVFTVLPFGLSVAPYCFTKIVRALVKFWHFNGTKIVVFIDDGAGAEENFQ